MRAFEFLTEWVKRKGYMQFYSTAHADERLRQRGVSDQKMETMLNNMGNDVSLQIFTEMTPMDEFWVYDPRTKLSVLLGSRGSGEDGIARFAMITVLNGRPGGSQTGKQLYKNNSTTIRGTNKAKIKNSSSRNKRDPVPYFHLKKGYITEMGFAGIPDYKTMPAYKLKKASKGKHKFFLPTDAPVPASVSALDEYKLDNERGLGSTPNNSNVDYMGFRTMMKPSVFLKLAKPGPNYFKKPWYFKTVRYQELVQKIKSGEGIGSPFLSIEIPDGWEEEPADFSRPTVVTGHEGRHRMHAIRELEGDVPVEVHLWGRFEGSELRRKYMTDEMFDELEKGLISETGQYIVNPFLSIQR